MKVQTLVCKQCGHEQKIKIYSPEEAERNLPRFGLPRCEKCGSANVKLYD